MGGMQLYFVSPLNRAKIISLGTAEGTAPLGFFSFFIRHPLPPYTRTTPGSEEPVVY